MKYKNYFILKLANIFKFLILIIKLFYLLLRLIKIILKILSEV